MSEITLSSGEKIDVPGVVAADYRKVKAEARLAVLKVKNDELEQMRRRRKNNRTLDAEERAEQAAELRANMPAPVTLTELLAEPRDDAAFIVDRLLAEDGRALFVAARKAGKTTTRNELIRALADGGEFLGQFPTKAVERIVVIDIEMSRGQIRAWLSDQGIENTDAVEIVPLRGKAATFDITDEATRTLWAEVLAGADVVVLDCLRPILDALGLNENTDAGRFLVAFDALMDEAEARAAVVIDHAGHANERARGDSRKEDWADALWYLEMEDRQDPTSERKFRAMGRDVEVAQGVMDYDAETRHVAYVPPAAENPKAAKAAAIRAVEMEAAHATRAWVEKQNAAGIHPTKTEVRRRMTDAGFKRRFVDDATDHYLETGEFVVKHVGNAQHLHVVDPLDAVPTKAVNPFGPEAAPDA